MTGLPSEFFADLKASTRGLMPVEVYRRLFEIARDTSTGNIIDAGTGRGGTSISLALGLRESKSAGTVHAIDQFFQNLADRPHRYNKVTNPDDCVALNIAEFEKNADRYGVRSLIKIWPGTTDEVAKVFPKDIRVGILAIDIDGHVDRDLRYFYDFVEPGGWIVIDDYADTIGPRREKRLAEFAAKSADEQREWLSRGGRMAKRRLLGKVLLTYRLANVLVDAGALTPPSVIKHTAFFRKPSDRPFSSFEVAGQISKMESGIQKEFLAKLRAARRTAIAEAAQA